MSLVKEDFIKRLESSLRDEAGELPPDDKERFLSQAVLMYSKDRPLRKVKEETGDGSTYDFDLADDWVDGFSYIASKIEYPSDDYQTPVYAEDNSWILFESLSDDERVVKLRFVSFIPLNGKTVRYVYAVPHTVSETSNTVKDTDVEAVVALAASLCFWALAAKYAQSTDSSVDADVIDYQRKSDTYETLAKAKVNMYRSLMGIGSAAKERSAANVGVSVKDMDINFSYGGDMLTHPSHRR